MATSTFYPYLDGSVYRFNNSQDWSNIRDGAGTGYSSAESNQSAIEVVADSTSNKWDYLGRSVFLFDTSELPNDDVISSATLYLYRYTSNAVDNFSETVHIVACTSTSTSALENADYGTLGSTSFSSKAIADMGSAQYYGFALNASGISNISKTGNSKFGTILACDLNNTAPTWASDNTSRCGLYFKAYTGTSRDPYLEVVHAPATNTKSINNLAKASIKSVNGLAIASVKSFNSLT